MDNRLLGPTKCPQILAQQRQRDKHERIGLPVRNVILYARQEHVQFEPLVSIC